MERGAHDNMGAIALIKTHYRHLLAPGVNDSIRSASPGRGGWEPAPLALGFKFIGDSPHDLRWSYVPPPADKKGQTRQQSGHDNIFKEDFRRQAGKKPVGSHPTFLLAG